MSRWLRAIPKSLIIFLCLTLAIEPTVAQVQVYVEGSSKEYDLESEMPEWVNLVNSPRDASWLIQYEISRKSQLRSKIISLPKVGYEGIKDGMLTGSVMWGFALLIGIGIDDRDGDEAKVFGGVFGILGAIAGVKSGLESRVITTDYYLKITITDIQSGKREVITTSSTRSMGSVIERELREMADDHTAPRVTVANLSTRKRRTLQSPLVNLDLEAKDDVALNKLEVKIGSITWTENEFSNPHKYTENFFYPLEVGDNIIEISASDLYGRNTTKTFQVFRARRESEPTDGVFVFSRSGKIMSGPGGGKAIQTTRTGDTYRIIDYQDGWYQVIVDERKQLEGWVSISKGGVRTAPLVAIEEEPDFAVGEPEVAYPPLLSLSTISFEEESGDGFLDAGEGGILSFNIVNKGKGIAADLALEVKVIDESNLRISAINVPAQVHPHDAAVARYRIIAPATISTGKSQLGVAATDRASNSPAPEMTFTIETRGRFSDVDLNIPRARRPNPNGVAVIIGNRDYAEKGIYSVEYALSDAETVKKYIVRTLGYREENIIFAPNASLSKVQDIFGSLQEPRGMLHDLVYPGKSDVFVFYSGHGAPGKEDRRGYLLPVDVKYEDARKSGFSIDFLGQILAALPARSVTVAVDACFSGTSEKGSLIKQASGPIIEVADPFLHMPNGSSFFASKGNQVSSWYPAQKHGLFTYYFLKGLQGDADENKDRKITAGELERYLKGIVPYQARRIANGRKQEPVVNAPEKNQILAAY